MVKKNIGELLLEYGIIQQSDIDEALVYQKDNGVRLGEALVALEKVTEYDIEYILSIQLDIPYVLIDDLIVDEQLIHKFPDDLLLSNRILPVFETDSEISIVTDDPFNTDAFEKMAAIIQKQVRLSSGSGSKITKVLNDFLCQSHGVTLYSEMEALINKVRGSKFFRIDFRISPVNCDIFIYGCGVLEEYKRVDTDVTLDDIFGVFDLLKLPFYYHIPKGNDDHFISIYPIESELQPVYPMGISDYGLVSIPSIHFADVKSYKIPQALYSEHPIEGYPFFSFLKRTDYHLAINICDGNDVQSTGGI